jgi:PAS domain S-box-containing protein
VPAFAGLISILNRLRDAAARPQAADDLLPDSECDLSLLADNVPVAITCCDAEGRYTFANKHFRERYGLLRDQIIGKRISEVIGHAAFAIIEHYVAECLAGKAVECEFETIDRAGEPMFLQGGFVPKCRYGKVVGLVEATTNITRLKLAEQRLRGGEITFRQLVDNSPFGIYVVDADFRVVQASIGARRRFENVQPLIGRDLADVLRFTWPEPFAGEVIAHFRHTLATGEPYHEPDSITHRKETGAVESYDWKTERVTMPDGRFGVVCHSYDLSERQKYEAGLRENQEQTQLLMREVNHRAKNMLSVVDAIAHQTATKSPEDFIERFSERIQALSANQDLLVRNEWRGVDVEDLVRAQLAPFAELIGSRIALHDSKIRLNAASAQAIGLSLHELVTNAGKYGALSTDKGRVDIGWGTDGSAFTMSWTEREGPPVSPPQRRGFGTIVMEQMTERSVGGRVDLEYAPSGVTWRLTCRAASALEP